jgi:hypothetical protein
MKEYASEFAKWILKNRWQQLSNDVWANDIWAKTFEQFTTAELIEMFDGEKN